MDINPAHLHLLVNHFPIIGSMVSVFILAYAMIVKNQAIKKLAYIFIVLCAASSLLANTTGEDAEEYIEKVMTVDHEIIESHEEAAELANYAMVLAGALSLIILFFKRAREYRYTPTIMLILLVVVVGLMANAGAKGGDITHTEIRDDQLLP